MTATPLPELVIAIIGPMGTHLREVCEHIEQSLRQSKYECEEIKVSSLISKVPGYEHLASIPDEHEDQRLNQFMDAGTEIRTKHGSGDILSRMVLASIYRFRAENGEKSDKPLPQTAFVVNSLKHPDEVELLRDIFKDRLFVISVYQPKEERIEKLARKIATSKTISDWKKLRQLATELIERDEKEEGLSLGQNTSAAFQYGDYFLNFNHKAKGEIDRFFDILFGKPFTTPTNDELYMLQAKSVAAMSADLSRQVGAIVATVDGDLIASGYNEVPCAGGGTNWEAVDSTKDRRDYTIHSDPNALLRDELVEEVFDVLKQNNLLAEEVAKEESSKLAKGALYGSNPVLKNKRIARLLEFGRVVHAEMNALSEAARRGLSVKGAILYCTTFPCHGCARHLLAAGVDSVVYIEPYPKSIAKQLYDDMIQVDGEKDCDAQSLSFKAFTGLSPDNFFRFFSKKSKRKEKQGKAFKNNRGTYPVGVDPLTNADTWKEKTVLDDLDRFLESMKVDEDSK